MFSCKVLHRDGVESTSTMYMQSVYMYMYRIYTSMYVKCMDSVLGALEQD